MNAIKVDYEMEKFNEENVDLMLKSLGFNGNNYLIAMIKPSILNTAVLGLVSEFANRYAIIYFTDTELDLVMLSRVNSKKVTEIIKIERSEINNISLSNILVSFMLNIKTIDSKMKFQVYKKVAKFTKLHDSLELFKKIYNL